MKKVVKKINKLSKKGLLVIVAGLLVVSVAGNVWLYLDGRSTNKELVASRSELTATQEAAYSAEKGLDGVSGVAEYEVLSMDSKKMRVQDMEQYNYKMLEDIPYKVAKVWVINVRVENTTESVFTLDGYSLTGKTSEGVLAASVIPHPADGKAYSPLSLAPGGKGTGTLYIEDTGKEIVSLYDTVNNIDIQL